MAASALSAQAPERIKIAIVGGGHRSWTHIQMLKAIPDFEIVAIADPTPEFRDRAASLAGAGAALYSDYRKMLDERKDLAAVAVVTPNFLHAEVAVAAFEHGLNVLSEKPMATTVEDANRMIAASEKAHKALQIGLQMRATPIFETARKTVREGAIGQLQFVTGNLFRGDWNQQSWKYTDPRTGTATNWRFLSHTAGSSLLEDGVHEIDILNWMIDAPVARLFATGGNNVLKQRETIDHAGLLIEYENGVKFSFDFCLFSPNAGPSRRRMFLVGSEGTLEPNEGKLLLRKLKGPARELEVPVASIPAIQGQRVGPDHDTGTYREYVEFARSIRTGARPICDGQEAKKVLKIALLAEKSIRERRVVDWSDLPA
jgi:predicted dehydrogenase